MAAYVKYQLGIEKMLEAGTAQTDTWKLQLSNTAPVVATDTTVTEIANANGYLTGGQTLTVSTAVSTAGVYKLTFNAPTAWTATGAGFTFQYVCLVNTTLGQAVGYWDYGSALVLSGANSDTFTPTISAETVSVT